MIHHPLFKEMKEFFGLFLPTVSLLAKILKI